VKPGVVRIKFPSIYDFSLFMVLLFGISRKSVGVIIRYGLLNIKKQPLLEKGLISTSLTLPPLSPKKQFRKKNFCALGAVRKGRLYRERGQKVCLEKTSMEEEVWDHSKQILQDVLCEQPHNLGAKILKLFYITVCFLIPSAT
jgi:hypothetical protein